MPRNIWIRNSRATSEKNVAEMKREREDPKQPELSAENYYDYEARFVQGEDDDAAGWVEYAYSAALDEQDTLGRRWSDLQD